MCLRAQEKLATRDWFVWPDIAGVCFGSFCFVYLAVPDAAFLACRLDLRRDLLRLLGPPCLWHGGWPLDYRVDATALESAWRRGNSPPLYEGH